MSFKITYALASTATSSFLNSTSTSSTSLTSYSASFLPHHLFRCESSHDPDYPHTPVWTPEYMLVPYSHHEVVDEYCCWCFKEVYELVCKIRDGQRCAPPTGGHRDRHRPDTNPETSTVFLGGLKAGIKEEEVLMLVVLFGPITSFNITLEQGTAFITFRYKWDARRAIDSLQALKVYGSEIRTNWAVPRRPQPQMNDTQRGDHLKMSPAPHAVDHRVALSPSLPPPAPTQTREPCSRSPPKSPASMQRHMRATCPPGRTWSGITGPPPPSTITTDCWNNWMLPTTAGRRGDQLYSGIASITGKRWSEQ
nr:uncharacterized protein CI109_002479 [Kwoniella shandongensis]KAA5529138.1 hypothetical protein CI109_002479 [Kwoniella shandongensis]